ncbi:Lipoprotein LipO precursor [compost metagenome]
MISEARIQYITGKIDDPEFDRLLETWRISGGDKVIQEINDAYRVRKNALKQSEEPVVNK